MDGRQSRKTEERGLEMQKLSWRLLCREAILTRWQQMFLDAVVWVGVVVAEQEASPEGKALNVQIFLPSGDPNVKAW